MDGSRTVSKKGRDVMVIRVIRLRCKRPSILNQTGAEINTGTHRTSSGEAQNRRPPDGGGGAGLDPASSVFHFDCREGDGEGTDPNRNHDVDLERAVEPVGR